MSWTMTCNRNLYINPNISLKHIYLKENHYRLTSMIFSPRIQTIFHFIPKIASSTLVFLVWICYCAFMIFILLFGQSIFKAPHLLGTSHSLIGPCGWSQSIRGDSQQRERSATCKPRLIHPTKTSWNSIWN